MEMPDVRRKELNQQLGKLTDLQLEIDKAKAIGLDVSEFQLARDALIEQIQNIKKNYFSGKP
jgi:hypothetical protein